MNNYKTMNIKLLTIISFTIFITQCTNKKESIRDSQQVRTTKRTNINKGDYSVNKDLSTIKWTGKEITTKSHYGTLDLKEGSVYVNNDGIISGNVLVDMTPGTCPHSKTIVCQVGILGHFEIFSLFCPKFPTF